MLSSHTDDVEKIKTKIEEQEVLVKVIESKPGDDTHWLFNLNQLKNPRTNRPVKTLRPEQKRDMIFDAEKQEWVTRRIDQKRGRKKDTKFIKKTPMTLPPSDGKMNYFGSHIQDAAAKENYVGLGFQLGEGLVQIKEKYIFEKNILSRESPWIFDEAKNNHTLAKPKLKSVKLEKIRENNDTAQAAGEILDWNEIISSPSLDAVRFLFAPYDTLNCRLNLLSKRALVKKELGQTLPVFIMGAATAVKEYSLHQQLIDLAELFQTKEKKYHIYRRDIIDFVQLAVVFLQEKEKEKILKPDSQERLYPSLHDLDEDMGALILALYNAGATRQLTILLNALKSPIKSKKLDECLYKTIENNDHKLAALLLANGADFNYCPSDTNTKTALSFAVEKERRAIFTEMMKLNKDRFKTTTLQQALLYAASLATESSAAYFASRLFNTNIDFPPIYNYWTDTGNYSLHSAVSRQYLSVTKLICQHNANPGMAAYVVEKNKTQNTPLDIAFKNQDYKAISVMLELGGHLLTAGQRGDALLRLLRAEQYPLAKSLLNSAAEIEINAYGADMASIIKAIALDQTLTELAKQTLALHFINKEFNAATTQTDMMRLVKLLKTCDAKAKAFLFQPSQSGTTMFHQWNTDKVCSFWSSIMKLAKNRLLEIINQSPAQPVEKEVTEFLNTRRMNLGFGSSTASAGILQEKDEKKRAQLITDAKGKLTDELSGKYGMRRI